MLKCFVACAFGKKDVDQMYKKAILHVLKEKNVKPLRVDKVEHNQNIYLKIIDLIRQSDFCISDLTYARPSVYYEAGYSTGLSHPVIYTVRKDHFFPKENDVFGNIRVHFDLQMKNIISWTGNNDFLSFRQRLMKRIDHVCQALWIKESVNKEVTKKRNKFAMVSVNQRLQAIREGVQTFLAKKGWHSYFMNKYGEERNMPEYFWKGKTIINPIYLDSATQTEISFSLGQFNQRHFETKSIKKGSDVQHHFVALRKIPYSRVESIFPSATIIDYQRIIKTATHYNDNNYYIHFISGLGFWEEYLEEIKSQTKYKYNSK